MAHLDFFSVGILTALGVMNLLQFVLDWESIMAHHAYDYCHGQEHSVRWSKATRIESVRLARKNTWLQLLTILAGYALAGFLVQRSSELGLGMAMGILVINVWHIVMTSLEKERKPDLDVVLRQWHNSKVQHKYRPETSI